MWINRQICIKTGWEGTGRLGVALTEPFQCGRIQCIGDLRVRVSKGQYWIVVKWADEEDPDVHKLAGLSLN